MTLSPQYSRIVNDRITHFSRLREQALINTSCNKLYRADIIKEYGITFPETISTAEDQFFVAAYWDRISTFCVIPDILYNYRQINTHAKTKQYNPEFPDFYIRFIETVILPMYKKNPVESERKAVNRLTLINAVRALAYISKFSRQMPYSEMKAKMHMVVDNHTVRNNVKHTSHPHFYYATMNVLIRLKRILPIIVFLKTYTVIKALFRENV